MTSAELLAELKAVIRETTVDPAWGDSRLYGWLAEAQDKFCEDTAENMRKYGGFIPGIRPGKRTAEFIDKILTRITLVGSIYLALVALLPEVLIAGFKVATIPVIGPSLDAILPTWFTQGLGLKFFFGGTSLLIVVGVAMDTVQQIESQLVMRHYDGFMRRGRIKGRR